MGEGGGKGGGQWRNQGSQTRQLKRQLCVDRRLLGETKLLR